MRLTESQKDKIMMLLCMGFGLLLILYVVIEKVNGQTFEPLRYKPNINEDEIIFCVKDVTNAQYRGQISCFISPADDILDKKTSDIIYGKASSLDDTFEMGLIDY